MRVTFRSLVIALILQAAIYAAPIKMMVYKTPTCGCCSKWVDHMKANGFDVTVQDVKSTAEYRQKYGVPERLQSCHTAVVGGYTIEGHVPAADVKQLLKDKPAARGIAVPGMPMGSPGMEGSRKDAFSVILFTDSKISIYRQYGN